MCDWKTSVVICSGKYGTAAAINGTVPIFSCKGVFDSLADKGIIERVDNDTFDVGDIRIRFNGLDMDWFGLYDK